MNDTPETDGEWNRIACYDHPQFEQGIAEFARKLERERDEAREVLREIRDNEVNPEDEADKFLRDHLPSELSKVREQRDAVTLRLGNTQERMFDAERQRDKLADAVNAATVLIAAKGRHNTMLAYEGLRKALATTNQPNL
jgi:predicted  nucleic acid-binding Zn-ribbon protein